MRFEKGLLKCEAFEKEFSDDTPDEESDVENSEVSPGGTD